MGGRARHTHLLKEPRPEENGAVAEAWCGPRTIYKWVTTTEDPLHRFLCPDCSKAYWATKTPTGYTIPKAGLTEAEREAVGQKWGYRAMFPVSNAEGEVIGFIALRNGFGAGYTVIPWAMRWEMGQTEPLAGSELKYIKQMPQTYDGELRFVSKDQALAAIPAMVEAGLLATKAEVIAECEREREEAAERRRQRAIADEQARVHREKREARYAEENDHITEAYRELLARADITNFQREGLLLAAARLKLKIEEAPA